MEKKKRKRKKLWEVTWEKGLIGNVWEFNKKAGRLFNNKNQNLKVQTQ